MPCLIGFTRFSHYEADEEILKLPESTLWRLSESLENMTLVISVDRAMRDTPVLQGTILDKLTSLVDILLSLTRNFGFSRHPKLMKFNNNLD